MLNVVLIVIGVMFVILSAWVVSVLLGLRAMVDEVEGNFVGLKDSYYRFVKYNNEYLTKEIAKDLNMLLDEINQLKGKKNGKRAKK